MMKRLHAYYGGEKDQQHSLHYGHYKALELFGRNYLRDIFQLMSETMKCGIVLERYKQTVTTILLKDELIGEN